MNVNFLELSLTAQKFVTSVRTNRISLEFQICVTVERMKIMAEKSKMID
ncbi:unnamed protein product [Tenebrio molitor]|nr:unnamed protein product [Tenebrio molitor]